MIALTKSAQPLTGRPIAVAPLLKLSTGHLFVSADSAGTAELPDGQKVVLETDSGGRLELITSNAPISVTAAGTYLDTSDLAKIAGAVANPKIRKYRAKDTRGKIFSNAGLLLLIGAIATLGTAVVGIILAFSGSSDTPTVDAAKASTVLNWARAPLDQVATTRDFNVTRREIDMRITTADDCLKILQGDAAPPATIPGVQCTAPSTSTWSAQTVGGVITAALALLTALLGGLGLASKYGFQQSPA